MSSTLIALLMTFATPISSYKASFVLPACYHNAEYLGVGDFLNPTPQGCINRYGDILSRQHFTLKKANGELTSAYYHSSAQSLNSFAAYWISKHTPDNPHECIVSYGYSKEPNL